MLIVGSSVTAGKFIALNTPVNLSMSLRFAVGSAALYLFMIYRGEKPLRLPLKSVLLIGVQALTGSVLFNVFLLKGLKTVSAVSSGIVSGFTPVMFTILAFVLLNEKPGRLKIIAAVTASAGVAAANADFSVAGMTGSTSGLLFVFAAVMCESLFLIMRRIIKTEISSLCLSLYLSLAGMLFFALPAAGEIKPLSIQELAVIAYYGIFITAAAYLLWLEGIKHVQASSASAYTAVMPISAVFTGVVFLGEPVMLRHIVGLTLVTAAIIMSGRK
jgi:drug/metabolite transporter (DMT)-like permease